MSDLLRVVERSQDHAMDIEDYLAREQLGEEGERPDRAAPRRRRRVSFAAELRAAAGGRLGGAARAPVRARHRRRDARRGALPLLRPPGLPLPDRLRAAARARRGARAAGRARCAASPRSRRRCSETEMALHVGVRRSAGGSRAAELEAEPARAGDRRRTRDFLLRTAALGDYAELVAALLPCMWGYAEIGERLAAAGAARARRLRGLDRDATPTREFQALAALGARADRRRGRRRRAGRARRACTRRSARRASTSWRSGSAGDRVYERRRMTELRTVRVAAVQATPVMLDAEATVAKAAACSPRRPPRAPSSRVLPETFVALYPSNAWARSAAAFSGHDELWERLWASAVDVPGPHVDALAAACARARHPLRDRRQRARVRAAGLALQRDAADRARRAAAQAPQADADDAGARCSTASAAATTSASPRRRSAGSAG